MGVNRSALITFVCSKSSIKTVEKVDVVLVFLLLTLNIFHTFL